MTDTLAGAIRAANHINECEAQVHHFPQWVPEDLAEIIARESGLADLLKAAKAAENLIGQSNKIDFDDEVLPPLRAAIGKVEK